MGRESSCAAHAQAAGSSSTGGASTPSQAGCRCAALACPVCFGDANSPLTIATNMGIIAMLVVVAGMIGAFASFFIYLNRRARRVAEQEGTV